MLLGGLAPPAARMLGMPRPDGGLCYLPPWTLTRLGAEMRSETVIPRVGNFPHPTDFSCHFSGLSMTGLREKTEAVPTLARLGSVDSLDRIKAS